MKKSTTSIRASHVNVGTGVAREDLAWPKTDGRVMRLGKTHVEVDERSTVTLYGGLDLAARFVRHFRLAQRLDARVELLKLHLPYHESDHILAQAFNLYAGGTCIEDGAILQHDEGVLRMLGACRLPDPTTSGDFLRRFELNPAMLGELRDVISEVQGQVWKRVAKRRRRRKEDWAMVDIDSHIKQLYGVQKEGADFSYDGRWSYHPLMLSLGETGECLAVRNRPGNVRSSHGAAELLTEELPRVVGGFNNVLVRGDSDFDRADVRKAAEKAGAYFAFVGREFKDRPAIAASIPEWEWEVLDTRAEMEREQRERRRGFRPRQKKANLRKKRARQRGYFDKNLLTQWVAEVPWSPPGSDRTYRLVIRRQLIEHHKGQEFLFNVYKYRYVVTNLPHSWSPDDVIDATYERCDQENVIEQMGSGLAMWRMPVAEFDGNSAWLEIARLAWNLGKWLAQLALPAEVVRWEWKRFRRAFVHVAAEVVKRSRQVLVRLSPAHRFAGTLVEAHARLQT